MPRRLSIAMVVTVVLACAGTTCLYSGAGPMDPATATAGGGWSPWLAAIADLLTLPIPTLGIADVRDVVLIFALGIVLLLAAAARWIGERGPKGQGAGGSSEDASASLPAGEFFKPGPAMRWLMACALGVLVLSCISLVVADNYEFSLGWMLRFVCGAGWAILIARFFTPQMTRAAVISLLAIGATAILLAFARARDVGYAHIAWPIGPITVTAALAGCWAAIAVVWAACRFITRKNTGDAIFASVALLAFIAALINSGRRSSAVGLVAAVFVIAAIALIQHKPTKGRIAGGIIAAVLLVAAGIAYVAREAASPDRVRSGPVQLRLTYLEKSWELIREHPLLGIGPDMFIVEMTNKIAPLRAVSPHVYHGGYDPTAHNEWLQAAVELGIPAAILYLALPLGVIAMALRRAKTTDDKLLIYPLAAGLLAICITETASVTLRGPIMPVWYWTLIGVVAAIARTQTGRSSTVSGPGPSRNLVYPICCLVASAICMLIVGLETYSSMRRTIFTPVRLFAEKALADNYAIASRALRGVKEADETAAWGKVLLSHWRRQFRLIPSYQNTAPRYAESLILMDRKGDAREILEIALSKDIVPYNPEANALYASLRNDPAVYLERQMHDLRAGAFDERMQSVFADYLGELNSPANQDRLRRARLVAKGGGDDEELAGPLVELLRISAFVKWRDRDWEGAVADQCLAAHCYRRLERESHPYRRAHEAETDAWYQLSRMLIQRQPDQWPEAFDAIREAERYAVLGINHEDLADPNPDWGYVGGEVVPTEFPEELRPLWRLSALLHVIAGQDRFLDLRIFASLPPEKWTPDELNRQLFGLAREAHAILARVSADKRPKHFDKLPQMAEYYWKQLSPPVTAPASSP